ncbi:MAG: DUF1302 domain-containing protein, partial [Limnobacter sp.]|nr:DUF1302 domain-containing protein [Limnobacter sp.]
MKTTKSKNAATMWVAGVLGMTGQTTLAGDFEGPMGTKGRWGMEVTVGMSSRLEDADASLVSRGNGGIAASNTVDDGNLNFEKGDVFSTVLKAIGEVDIHKDGKGAFIRAKAYSDITLQNTSVPHGASNTGYVRNQPLSDAGFPDGSKFEDLQLLDAYAYWDTEIAEKPASFKLGRQVVTWGEGLFIQGGINQYSNVDAAALRRPGAQLKEVFLPIPQIYGNFQATDSLSLEGFVQFNHEKLSVDGCGTLFSPADLLNCGSSGTGVNPGALELGGSGLYADFSGYTDREAMFGGGSPQVVMADGTEVGPLSAVLGAAAANINFKLDEAQERRARDTGQVGLAMRYFSEQFDTEFGVYAVNYHQRIPNLSLINRPTADSNSVFSGQGVGATFGIPGLSYFFDWGAEDIQVLGISAATEIGGWSVFGEISSTEDYPAPLNTPDLVKGAGTGTGPLSRYQAQAENNPDGTQVLQGFKQLDKIQVQASTIKLFPRTLGTSTIALIGEIGFQFWDGIEDPFTGERIGRNPAFGAATHAQYNGGDCDIGVNASANLDPRYCAADGFATSTVGAYRLLTVFQYPNLWSGVNVAPRAFLSHDFKGNSADGLLIEGRINVGLGIKADIQSGKYFAD